MERAWIRESHVSLHTDHDDTGDHGFLQYLFVSFLIPYFYPFPITFMMITSAVHLYGLGQVIHCLIIKFHFTSSIQNNSSGPKIPRRDNVIGSRINFIQDREGPFITEKNGLPIDSYGGAKVTMGDRQYVQPSQLITRTRGGMMIWNKSRLERNLDCDRTALPNRFMTK